MQHADATRVASVGGTSRDSRYSRDEEAPLEIDGAADRLDENPPTSQRASRRKIGRQRYSSVDATAGSSGGGSRRTETVVIAAVVVIAAAGILLILSESDAETARTAATSAAFVLPHPLQPPPSPAEPQRHASLLNRPPAPHVDVISSPPPPPSSPPPLTPPRVPSYPSAPPPPCHPSPSPPPPPCPPPPFTLPPFDASFSLPQVLNERFRRDVTTTDPDAPLSAGVLIHQVDGLQVQPLLRLHLFSITSAMHLFLPARPSAAAL